MQTRKMPGRLSATELLSPAKSIDTDLIAAVHGLSLGASASSRAFILIRIKGYRFLAAELDNCGRHQHGRRRRLEKAFADCESILKSYLPLCEATDHRLEATGKLDLAAVAATAAGC